jgi:hypothetical protein
VRIMITNVPAIVNKKFFLQYAGFPCAGCGTTGGEAAFSTQGAFFCVSLFLCISLCYNTSVKYMMNVN